MSDKETARKVMAFLQSIDWSASSHEWKVARLAELIAEECTVQAPTQCELCNSGHTPQGHLYHLTDEGRPTCKNCNCFECLGKRGATPQGTPWKSSFTHSDVTGNIHNYVDTGDGKRLWAEDADEIVKRHNAPQGTPDTQWIKPKFPATTPEEWREFGKTLATPDKCPTCGALHKKMWYPALAEHVCADPWHQTTGLFPPNSSKNWQKEK